MTEERGTRGDERVVWLLLAATFVVILNETIMNVALRPLMVELDVTARAAQWLASAFMLTTAIIIPITGFLILRFTTKTLFVVAMGLFSLGTLGAMLAPGFGVLLVARIVQACGTAVMMPLLMTTVMTVVPVHRRGRMMGNMSIVISVAPALGPTLSGLVLHLLSWRWMFGIVLPLALVMLVIGMRRVRNVGEQRSTPVDVLSVVLSAIGFGGIVYGLSRIGADDGAGGSLPMWLALAAELAGIVLFVLRQLRLQRRESALLDLRVFLSPVFSLATALNTVSMLGLFGMLIMLPIYLEQVLGLEPLATGLLLLPGGLIMGLVSPTIGRLYDRVGPRPLAVPGFLVSTGALLGLALVTERTSPWLVLGIHVGLSIGLALILTPVFTAGLGAVVPRLYAHGSAVVSTLEQVAGAAGAALFVTIMASESATLLAQGAAESAAAAGGVRAAFLIGGLIFAAATVGSFFLGRPDEDASLLAERSAAATS